MKNQTQILLSRWAFFWSYLWAVTMIPVAGIGLILLWRVEKKRKGKAVIAESERIRIPDPDTPGEQRVLDLLVIQKIELVSSSIPGKWFGIGSLVFHVGSGEIKLDGVRNANRLRETIHKAIEELNKSKRSSPNERVKSETIPGSTDQMNELTFLWQQGLITDDQFEQEKKKFSN